MKGHERLAILADHLEKMAIKGNPKVQHFDLRVWIFRSATEHRTQLGFDPRGSDVPVDPKVNLNHYDCGTVACALGFATMIPDLRKEGLLRDRASGVPKYNDNFGIYAAVRFFDISYEQANRLFYPEFYRRQGRTDPMAVAVRIRRILKTLK